MHNYIRKIERLQAEGKLPTTVGLHEITTLHDEWCRFLKGGECNCDPDIRMGAPTAAEHKDWYGGRTFHLSPAKR